MLLGICSDIRWGTETEGLEPVESFHCKHLNPFSDVHMGREQYEAAECSKCGPINKYSWLQEGWDLIMTIFRGREGNFVGVSEQSWKVWLTLASLSEGISRVLMPQQGREAGQLSLQGWWLHCFLSVRQACWATRPARQVIPLHQGARGTEWNKRWRQFK